ncbi:transposase, IS4 family [Magnetococcus marinus MC-1]|uniref:Transposase, IS4 family n=1 Tax=Magnetococcus marinus (strain ATCC BAA-1437 / JCM 17883 / MC-1) TaxID=156889 RepID=A0LAZ1_MAGMM|nr:IS1634 family transposase [Magnetococcus marinus]ABK45134.1 transposase, IS4 family [Magnetococcus marinus MC-1]
MHIERVPNRNSHPTVLLRESYRENGKVKKRTLGNLTGQPEETIEALRVVLKGGRMMPMTSALTIEASLPHGHVAAVAGVMKSLGLKRLLGTKQTRYRDLVLALIAQRVLQPASKLASHRLFNTTTLGQEFGVDDANKEELYKALDWLGAQQERIENRLVKQHLQDGSMVLFDLTSTYLEGRQCELAEYGYSRDHRPDKLQIEIGLLCDKEGRPLAVEVFPGHTGDPTTLTAQVNKLKARFGLKRVIVVGDRGMITQARIDEDIQPAGFSWITALRHSTIRSLAKADNWPSLFDARNFAEITSPDFPGERLMVCRNPFLAEDQGRSRRELLAIAEQGLETILQAVQEGSLRDCGQIGKRADRVLRKLKIARYFNLEIAPGRFIWSRKQAVIDQETALDGIYVVRTNLPEKEISSADTIRQYKSLAQVESAFRDLKSSLDIRPIFHFRADRIKAHVFLCMLAYMVEREMRIKLKTLLFTDEAPLLPDDPVMPREPSPNAKEKTGTRRSPTGHALQSFSTLLEQLATLTRNTVRAQWEPAAGKPFEMLANITPLQQEAFRLLSISP